MTENIQWNDHYRDGNLPWDTGRPSSELQRIVSQYAIEPCRALDIGCGTGTNSVWLAQQGFEVTGIDLAPLAIERADERARAAGVEDRAKNNVSAAPSPLAGEAGEGEGIHGSSFSRPATVHFLAADVLNLPDLGAPFGFFFDRGCYHAVRREAPHQYAPAVARQLAEGARGLILAGNAREPHDPGPPVVTEQQLREELTPTFQILDLQEFRFDEAPSVPMRFLGWSCLVESANR